MALKVDMIDVVRLGSEHEGKVALIGGLRKDSRADTFEDCCVLDITTVLTFLVVNQAQVCNNWCIQLNFRLLKAFECLLDFSDNISLTCVEGPRNLALSAVKVTNFL